MIKESTKMRRSFCNWMLLVISIGVLTGCAGPMLKPANFSPLPAAERKAPPADYRLRVGDELAVKFYYQKDLNEEQVIRPDGKISLQLIEEIKAAGLTPTELSHVISMEYRKFTRQFQATVIVRRTVQDRVYIAGEVNQPGTVPYVANLTVLQALFQSGGFRESGEISTIMLIRRGEDGKPAVCSIDLRDPINDVDLQPFDVLYVPRSAIASADLFVYQYIDKLIPISRNFGFSFVTDLTKTWTGGY
jgi:protein involved in polysaccharide export with SLBB domain